ncbi:NifB/NifX family molybdenum-iron cluster-binding protein [Candidatus Zixiibacteriota bacterium]
MLACIPTNGNTGREDTVSDHFGSAPYFTLFNTDDQQVAVVDNRNAHHSHGTCHPLNQLAKHRINCIVCLGMGRRAIEALNAEGIKIYHAESQAVGEVIDKIKANELTEIDPVKACRGHGQRGGCAPGGSGREPGRGAGFGQMGRQPRPRDDGSGRRRGQLND